MNLKKTYKFAAVTALLLSFFLALSLSVFLFFSGDLNVKLLVFSSLFCFVLSFVIIQFRIERYIFRKIEKIYNDVIFLESETGPVKTVPTSTDLDFLTKALSQYTKLKKTELESFKAREEFRKEFIGNVAHELKTPLFTVQGYISTLLDGAMTDKDILKKYLKRADKGVDRLIYIVQDLDMITKIEFGDAKLEKLNFDIVELIKNVFEELEMKAKKKNILLSLDELTEPSILVYADMERIQQVLTNLVVNSIKYGHSNGTTEISVESINPEKVVVRVTDNGEGIEEEHIPRLFERFYRVDKSGARSEGGSGLGLAIVKHILEAHNEKIHIESKYGIGSEFSFTLQKQL
ncbi:ATP-binding protein [Flavobacteriaceae bacterium]|jgi:two-component system, OmpR family, phosphate regulon sensor histidine kinase PhoR|nr:ATP-binding protein [Flavobacteriaceae bacterium]MDB2632425.1 ATP-binding protein [Flavobacteriaceae bacterium]